MSTAPVVVRGPRRDRATFDRWGARLFPTHGPAQLDRVWLQAQREVCGRAALALAREQLADAHVRADGLRVAGFDVPVRVRAPLELHALDLVAPRAPALDDVARLTESWWANPAIRWPTMTPDDRARVAAELADSAFNLALALAALDPSVDRASTTDQRTTDTRWAADDPRLHDGEHHVAWGHPWHPMTKTRLGLGLAEHARLAPELLARTEVQAVDLLRDDVLLAGDSERLSELMARAFGSPPPGWVRLPLHPTQRRRLAGTAARPVAAAPLVTRSLLSLRTVDVAEHGVHLKLATHMHTTSARRVVSTMSVHNGPEFTALLRSIATRDPIAGALRIGGDVAAAGRTDAAAAAARDAGDTAEIGVIVRDREDFLTPTGTPALVCAALASPTRAGSPPALVAWLARFGSATALLDAYLAGLVPPTLRHASVYGVALEVHLQNTLVWLAEPAEGSGPRLQFVVRDLGGLRVHGPRLSAAGLRVDTASGSFTRTEDAREVLDKVAHCLFHAHLAWMIRSLHELAGLDFAAAWSQVRDLVDRCYARWRRDDPALREQLDHDHAALCAARTRVKCLLTMRLLDRSSDYVFTELANPLADAPG